jgi:hypothetical protein
LNTQRQILVFGNSDTLGALAAMLRVSPLLHVMERQTLEGAASPDNAWPDVILVDATRITPEQFRDLLAAYPQPCPILLGIDPLTCQLTVLSSPNSANQLAEAARVIGILSLTLPGEAGHTHQRRMT